MTRIGILGGTFDPVHIGHIALARAAIAQYDLYRVHFMTGGNPPHKRSRAITDATIRHDLVKLALMGERRLVADDFEVMRTEYSYTANTLTELRALHPDWEIYFIIGEDSLSDLPKWYKPEIVVKNCILLVYPRDNNSQLNVLIRERKAEFGADIRPIVAPLVDVSSTKIREMVHRGEDVSEYVSRDVLQYINEKGLYR